MKRTCLVTGATGFVGANLVRRLLGLGHEVCLLVQPGYQRWRIEDLTDELTVRITDIRDPGDVAESMRIVQPDWVFHLAAFGAYSWQTDARRILATNVEGTFNLLDAAARQGVEAFVNTGSSSEYGYRSQAPAEGDLPDPNSDYAMTKTAATLMCRSMAVRHDLNASTLRLYSVYGPWEEPNRLMPTLVSHALRGDLPPLVGAGTVRDFVYVDDVVDAYLLAAEAGPAIRGEVFNVGTGTETTLAELVGLVRHQFGVAPEPDWGSMAPRAWDTKSWVADAGLIRRSLGWAPRHPLAEGIGLLARWLTGRREYHGAATPASAATRTPAVAAVPASAPG